MRSRAPLLAASILLLGCGNATGILVEVTSSDLSIPGDVDTLRFQATSSANHQVDRTFPVTGGWPQSLTIVPASSADSSVTITVTALEGGSFVVRRVVSATFVRGSTRTIHVTLSRACAGVMCPSGVDCMAGRCAGGPGADGGLDGGGTDAGMGADGGPAMDSGPPPDAGTDGGTDGGVDAGTDSGPPTPRCATSPSPCLGLLLISELAPAGPGGASDEFVELYNRGSTAVNASGVELAYAATTTSSPSSRTTLPAGTVIPAGGFYLLASSGYAGATTPDAAAPWTRGFASTRGSVMLLSGTQTLDLVGWQQPGQTAPMAEGTPVLGASDAELSAGASYERKAQASSTAASMGPGGADERAGNGYDTDDNVTDFVQRAIRQPQNSSSPLEP